MYPFSVLQFLCNRLFLNINKLFSIVNNIVLIPEYILVLYFCQLWMFEELLKYKPLVRNDPTPTPYQYSKYGNSAFCFILIIIFFNVAFFAKIRTCGQTYCSEKILRQVGIWRKIIWLITVAVEIVVCTKTHIESYAKLKFHFLIATIKRY